MRNSGQLAIAILLLFSTGVNAANGVKEVISCENSSLPEAGELSSDVVLSDQACMKINLGTLDPGSTLFFRIDTDVEIDILLFPAVNLDVYLGGQNYRSDSVWESDSVFEGFSGDGEWHWEVPDDRPTTGWYLVIDNKNHPQDEGEGGQGGQSAEVSIEAGMINSGPYTLSDSIHRLWVNSFSVSHGPFAVDEGSFLNIHARTMEGSPDIFVMTESDFSSYSSTGSTSSRIFSADMLQIIDERVLLWKVSDIENEQLYVVIDNKEGPGGGSAGDSPAAVTVTVSISPILQPIITSESDLDSVDVSQEVEFSAMESPNKSNQIDEESFRWDWDGDGFADQVGPVATKSWPAPGEYSIGLSISSVEGQNSNSTATVNVSDLSNPFVDISANSPVTKSFGETLMISGAFSDNWGVDHVEWKIDGVTVLSEGNISEQSSLLSIDITSNFSAGDHDLSLEVTDLAGHKSKDNVTIRFIDITPPIITATEEDVIATVGIPVALEALAIDNESQFLIYSWIFNKGSGSESSIDDARVIHTFYEDGPQYIFLRVENEAGLIQEKQILVNVQKDAQGDGLGVIGKATILLVFVGLIGVLGLVAYNFAVSRRVSEISLKEEVTEEEEDQESQKPVDPAIWAKTDLDSQYYAQKPRGGVVSELDVSALIEEGSATLNDEQDLGLLSELNDLGFEDQTSGALDASENRSVRECPSCHQPFELVFPEGVKSAYTKCPSCDFEHLVENDESAN